VADVPTLAPQSQPAPALAVVGCAAGTGGRP
jgi:hypothetical protein